MTSRLQRQIQCNLCHSRICIERIYNKMGNFEESPSENLKDYFLNFLPTTSFKLSVKNSPRYKQISDIFCIKDTLPFTFNKVSVNELLWNLTAKFMKSKYLREEINRKKKVCLSNQFDSRRRTHSENTKTNEDDWYRHLSLLQRSKRVTMKKRFDKTWYRVIKNSFSNCKVSFLLKSPTLLQTFAMLCQI